MFNSKLNMDKPPQVNGFVPNKSNLHRVTTPGSQIPKMQQPVKTCSGAVPDITIDRNRVINFLKTIEAKENNSVVAPVRNQSQLYKTNSNSEDKKPLAANGHVNHLGLKKVSSGETMLKNEDITPPQNMFPIKRIAQNGHGSYAGPRQGTDAHNGYISHPGLKRVPSGGAEVQSGQVNLQGLKRSPSSDAEGSNGSKDTSNGFVALKKVVTGVDSALRRDGMVANFNRSADEWKCKYEEAEKRRKELLADSQKAMRDKNSLEKQMQRLQADYNSLSSVCDDRTQQLDKLRQVSEQVYQDYDKLNLKYETETTTLHKALEVASKWYKENKKLKRESIALRSGADVKGLDDVVDGEPEQQDELEELRKTVQELSNQVGQLQAELNRARLHEFEAQEQFINLNQALDEERKHKESLETELRELRLLKTKFENVSYMVHDEMQALRSERDRATEQATRLQVEAHHAQKERNVLAHQSTVLMGDHSSDEKLLRVLQEMEDLKRKLEEETQRHAMDVNAMERRLEETESEAQLELMEEKLKLAESELQLALEKVESAERSKRVLSTKVCELESQLGGAPMPPPPPPPPLPPPMLSLHDSPLKIHKTKKSTGKGDSLDDMANLLGIQRQPTPANVQGGAIDDLINEIKCGKYTLKATEKQKQKLKKEEPPQAVQEMLSIIGTLKRRPKNARPPADVHLHDCD